MSVPVAYKGENKIAVSPILELILKVLVCTLKFQRSETQGRANRRNSQGMMRELHLLPLVMLAPNPGHSTLYRLPLSNLNL